MPRVVRTHLTLSSCNLEGGTEHILADQKKLSSAKQVEMLLSWLLDR